MDRRRKLADVVATAAVYGAAPALKFLSAHRAVLPRFQRACDKLGFQLRGMSYYEPIYRDMDLPADVSGPRHLPGIDMNEAVQIALLRQFDYADELRRFPMEKTSRLKFAYRNRMCEQGVAEILYSMVRHFRPACLIEVGAGNSTLMIQEAAAANRADDPGYRLRHICIEPYENEWLVQLDVEVVRERVEHLPLALFGELRANDILFIDSSHAVRPFGDVVFQMLQVLPGLAPGVLVSIDDIFTPWDYPEHWLRRLRRGWTEQYLLEAFLSHNRDFEILCAINWLYKAHRAELVRVCPVLSNFPDHSPGAMWLRRLPPAPAALETGNGPGQ